MAKQTTRERTRQENGRPLRSSRSLLHLALGAAGGAVQGVEDLMQATEELAERYEQRGREIEEEGLEALRNVRSNTDTRLKGLRDRSSRFLSRFEILPQGLFGVLPQGFIDRINDQLVAIRGGLPGLANGERADLPDNCDAGDDGDGEVGNRDN